MIINILRRSVLAGCACLCPALAFAGPCSADIAAIGRQLSQSPALGPATTGTLTGSNPGARVGGQSPVADQHGTSADQRVGGTAGTKELDAVSSNVATSDADVRQQQLGHPTAAAQSRSNGVETAPGSHPGTASAADDRMSRAKTAWQKAVDLNAQNDPRCEGAVAEARSVMRGS